MEPVDRAAPAEIVLAWADDDLDEGAGAPEDGDEEAAFEASTDLRRWWLERSATLAKDPE